MTLFKVLYRRDPPTLIRYNDGPSDNPTVQEQMSARDNIIAQLKTHLRNSVSYETIGWQEKKGLEVWH